jgi:hypothetical protein
MYPGGQRVGADGFDVTGGGVGPLLLLQTLGYDRVYDIKRVKWRYTIRLENLANHHSSTIKNYMCS